MLERMEPRIEAWTMSIFPCTRAITKTMSSYKAMDQY